MPLEPYPARFARHLPHAGKALSVDIVFPHISCIRSDNARKAVSSYRSLPHWGRGTALAVDRVLSLMAHLRRSLPLVFHTAFPMQGKWCYPCAIIHNQHCPYEGNQRGAGSILRLFDCHAFSGGNPLHPLSNVLPHRRRGQDRPARGIPLCGYSL